MRFVTIERLFEPVTMFPYYEGGLFPAVPKGMDCAKFCEGMRNVLRIYKIYEARYNGKVSCYFEARYVGEHDEVHAFWVDDNKMERAIVLKEFLKQHDRPIVTFADEENSTGHLSLTKRGVVNHVGNINDINIFTHGY